jgi:hypothetical protein
MLAETVTGVGDENQMIEKSMARNLQRNQSTNIRIESIHKASPHSVTNAVFPKGKNCSF